MSFAMNKKQTLNILMASSAAILLQGCAAALVPLAAGGLMGRAAETDPTGEEGAASRTSTPEEIASGSVEVARSETPAPQPTPPPPPAPAPEPEPEPPAPVVVQTMPEPQPTPTPPAPAEPAPSEPVAVVVQTLPETPAEPEPVSEPAPTSQPSETRVIRIARAQGVEEPARNISAAEAAAAVAASRAAEAEAPAEPNAPAAPAARAVSPNAITSLISYANQQRFEPMGSRSSAILADRITLEPERAPCLGVRPTVLIDLDPAGGVLSPADASRPPSGLAGGLEQLREDGVDIAWISSNPASAANVIRETLRQTGLDPYGRDQLLLVRNSDDRKQTLRDGLAESTCIVAIAGDARSDFDELYDYLLNPEDAASLDPLIGDGWFIIPQPLLSEGNDQ